MKRELLARKSTKPANKCRVTSRCTLWNISLSSLLTSQKFFAVLSASTGIKYYHFEIIKLSLTAA